MATNACDVALPDELLLDIFARLSADPLDLLRCAATCTSWLRLLTADDAAFLRLAGVLPKNTNASVLLGAFYQHEYLVPGSAEATISDSPMRFWRLHTLPPADDLTTSLFSVLPKHDGLFNYAKPLASRGGLLLVRLMPTPPDYRKLHLAVCHPILGGVHLIPPPVVDLHPWLLGRDVTGYALLTGYGGEGLHDHRQRRLAFRVLFTAVHVDKVVYIYSYSSATGSWSVPIMCPLQLRHLTMSGPRAGVVDGHGTTHWLYRGLKYFYTLNVSADTMHISLTKIPILVEGDHRRRIVVQPQPPFPCITEGGRLSFVVKRPDYDMLRVWIKPDQDEEWIHYNFPMFQTLFTRFKIIGFAESRGAIIVKSCHGLSCLDLESKEMELLSESSEYPREVCSIPMCQGYYSCTYCTNNHCVLYEMDWPSYLVHLSAWSPRGTTR